jgi:probable F420-dependent oxidoreductase
MRIGFGLPVSGAWARPDTVVDFAGRAEKLGYESLWTFQRLLADPNEMEVVNRSVLDPFIALTFAGASTARIRLGLGVVHFPFLPPVLLAKQAATLDVLTGGRVEIGLGLGWSSLEFTVMGADRSRRGPRSEEYVHALRALFADGTTEFAGDFYEIPPCRMEPKPVQRPSPPILLAGSGTGTQERAGRIADGWISSTGHADLNVIGEYARTVRETAEKAGRDPASIRIACRGVVVADPAETPAGERPRLTGTYEQIREDTEWLAAQGVTDLFYDVNWDERIGSPDADPVEARERAERTLDALAPGDAAS